MDKNLLEIKNELVQYFPDGFYQDQREIRKLSVVKKINNYIYKQKAYTKKNITFSQVLDKVGLKKLDYYDIKRMRFIHDNFDITYDRWAEFFGGITRQAIEHAMKNNILRDYYQWFNLELSQKDYTFIQNKLILKGKFMAYNPDESKTYYLINNSRKASNISEARVVLLIREGDKKIVKYILMRILEKH